MLTDHRDEYLGVPLDEMTEEELREAVRELARQAETQRGEYERLLRAIRHD